MEKNAKGKKKKNEGIRRPSSKQACQRQAFKDHSKEKKKKKRNKENWRERRPGERRTRPFTSSGKK